MGVAVPEGSSLSMWYLERPVKEKTDYEELGGEEHSREKL